MSFSPLGSFDQNAAVNPGILVKARTFMNALPSVPAHGITRCYLHWTVAPMGCDFSDYNAEAKIEAGNWVLKLETSPANNVAGLNDGIIASHTWHRNTGAVGIAITGMDGATENNFGPDGVTLTGLAYLCAGAAALCAKYDIDATGKVAAPGTNHLDNAGNNVNTTGEWNILTHAECAVLDLYTGERWDLGSFVALPKGVYLTPEMRSQCGDALRKQIKAYKIALANK